MSKSEAISCNGLRLEIVEARRGEIPSRRHCDFVFPGGTLGRGEDNDLMLPDPTGEIALLQALIYIVHSGQHQVSNRGGLEIRLNGLTIERGQQRPLAAGDTLEIGSFVLRSSEILEENQRSQEAAAASLELSEKPQEAQLKGSVPTEIWASLAAEFAPAVNKPTPIDTQHPLLQTEPPPRPVNPLLLEDAPAKPRTESPTADLSALFAPNPLTMQDHIMTDTTPTVLVPRSKQEPVADTFMGAALAFEMEACEPAPPAPLPQQHDSLVEDPLLHLFESSVPLSPPTSNAHLPSSEIRPEETWTAINPVPSAPHSAAPVSEVWRNGEMEPHLPAELSQALLEGMGLGSTPLTQSDRDRLYMVGRLLRLLAQGVIDLLASGRATAPPNKQTSQGQNPFSVFPDSDSALIQLFEQPLPGFMPPEAAIQHAFADLRAMQLAPQAGALVRGWLDRLDPQQLEEQFDAGQRNFLRLNRRAHLWRFYAEQHQQVSQELDQVLARSTRQPIRHTVT